MRAGPACVMSIMRKVTRELDPDHALLTQFARQKAALDISLAYEGSTRSRNDTSVYYK